MIDAVTGIIAREDTLDVFSDGGVCFFGVRHEIYYTRKTKPLLFGGVIV